jgi:molecular chaperone GrpE (heat shock protein)
MRIVAWLALCIVAGVSVPAKALVSTQVSETEFARVEHQAATITIMSVSLVASQDKDAFGGEGRGPESRNLHAMVRTTLFAVVLVSFATIIAGFLLIQKLSRLGRDIKSRADETAGKLLGEVALLTQLVKDFDAKQAELLAAMGARLQLSNAAGEGILPLPLPEPTLQLLGEVRRRLDEQTSDISQLSARFVEFSDKFNLMAGISRPVDEPPTWPRSVASLRSAGGDGPLNSVVGGDPFPEPGGSAGNLSQNRAPGQEDQANGGASAVLRRLAESYLNAAPGEAIANRLDQTISDVFRASTPRIDGLQDCGRRAECLATEVDRLLQGVSAPEMHEKLKPLLNEVRQLQAEMDDLFLASANSMRLRFNVDFYTSAANRDRLIDGIGAGLKRQIVKLENPVEYFNRQFQSLAVASAECAADTLDVAVDPKRSQDAIQDLLSGILRAAGLEQIAPKPGEDFRSDEQSATQKMSHPDGKNGPASVGRLITRGFRCGGEVIRRAAVVVYE